MDGSVVRPPSLGSVTPTTNVQMSYKWRWLIPRDNAKREGEEGVWGKKTGRIARLPSTSSQQTIMLTCSWLSNEKQVIEKASGNENNHITQ